MTRSCMDEAQNSKRHKSSTRNRSSFAMHRLIGRKAEAASYSDDASNNRVRSEINGTAYELLFNLTGQKVAITSGGAVVEEDTHLGAAPLAAFFNGSLNFEHQDWLGTERFLTGSDGSPIGNYTSYPFGDGYVDNGVDLDPYHFAGMDHDYESTLDHATFREYASAGGRWLSPDPYQGSYDWSNPQSLNRYAYVLNDPLSMSDPSGQDPCLAGIAGTSEGGPIGVGIGVGACIADLFGAGNFINDLLGIFSGPSFHGSLKPRPNAQPWDEGNIIYGSNIAGALGLPDQTCEFGACGGGGYNLQAGDTLAAGGGPIMFNIPAELFNINSLLVAQYNVGLKGLSRDGLKIACSSSASKKIFGSVKSGALTGAAKGAYSGFSTGEIFGGEVTLGLSGAAGALAGGFIQGVTGASAGVVSGSAQAEACQLAGAYN